MTQFIFIDIDGTLLDHQRGIPESAKKAIQSARNKGHKVFICTGRARTEVSSAIERIGFDGYICSAGAYVETEGSLLNNQCIPPEVLMPLCHQLSLAGAGYVLEGTPYSFWDPFAQTFLTEVSERVLQKNPELASLLVNIEKLKPLSDFDPGQSGVNKISAFAPKMELLLQLKSLIPEGLNLLVHDKPLSTIYNGEISIADTHKATGVQLILDHWKASIENTVAFGDSLNDLEMVEICHVGISMGNGSPELKAIADDVTDTVWNDGIYKGFLKYGLCDPQ